MRYLVHALLRPGREKSLLEAIENRTLGQGSVAEGEYLKNMSEARQLPDEKVCWVEVCYCPTPLQEEKPYWEDFFELVKVQDAHDRRKCRDFNRTEPWSCGDCDCTRRLEEKLRSRGTPFVQKLGKAVVGAAMGGLLTTAAGGGPRTGPQPLSLEKKRNQGIDDQDGE
jgi:hypothetical protein